MESIALCICPGMLVVQDITEQELSKAVGCKNSIAQLE